MNVSVIICSNNDLRFKQVEQAYHQTLAGESFEIIRIPDARSLAEGYNRGIALARGELVIFSHDDVELAAPTAWKRIQGHMAHCDLLGLAGARYFGGISWAVVGPPYIAGQVATPLSTLNSQEPGFLITVHGVTSPRMDGMQILDGLFFAAHRAVVKQVQFDAAIFDGFHGYDLDFSYNAFTRGFRLAVATDLAPIHTSGGKFDEIWKGYALRVMEKYQGILPPLVVRRHKLATVVVSDRMELLQVMLPDEFPLPGMMAAKSGINITGVSRM